MFNPALSPADLAIVLANIFGTMYAMYWNFKASKIGNPLYASHLRVGMFAAVYLGFFLWLLFTNVEQSTWSLPARGLAPLSFIYVYAGPSKAEFRSACEMISILEKKIIEKMDAETERAGCEE